MCQNLIGKTEMDISAAREQHSALLGRLMRGAGGMMRPCTRRIGCTACRTGRNGICGRSGGRLRHSWIAFAKPIWRRSKHRCGVIWNG